MSPPRGSSQVHTSIGKGCAAIRNGATMPMAEAHHVFKIATRTAWEEACRLGLFAGSDDDLRDGFIHLSTAHQLAGTLAKHFKGQTDLVLITLDADALGEKLKWERARDGDLFPHLYAELPTSAALKVRGLSCNGGVPIVPEEGRQC
jgi:uncharacterized protein (DUF952 family)